MKNPQIVALTVLVVLLVASPICNAASTLAKPTVTLPSGWQPNGETVYPNAQAEHDPRGAGLVEFQDSSNLDFVMIYYENAPSQAYTDAALKNEAIAIFQRDHDGLTVTESGVRDFAGVKAGWAKGYEADYDIYDLEVVMVKNGYYMNAYSAYDGTNQSQTNVENLLNSINVSASGSAGNTTILGLDQTMFFVLIAVVAAIIVVAVAVVVVKRRKQPTQQTPQGAYPPPPPPQ